MCIPKRSKSMIIRWCKLCGFSNGSRSTFCVPMIPKSRCDLVSFGKTLYYPGHSKRDAVDVAPSVPAREAEPAAEPSPENKPAAVPTTVTAEPATVEPATAEPATAPEPTTAEPARRGPVDQELDLTLDNPTDRALSTGQIANQIENDNYSSRSMPPKKDSIRGENGNIRIFYERH